MRQKHSEYMHWAKTQSRARYNLATSGVGSFPLRDLELKLEQLEINTDSAYGFQPLQHAIAQHCEVAPECVVAAAGTSFANHLAMAALIEPGDEVLIEHPAYELLVSTARYLGARVNRFGRAEEHGYAIDPEVVRRAVTPNTKLIVITNLHNPSSVLTSEKTLREVGEIARSVGARVLVDEVYLDVVYENTPRSSFHLGREFVVTSSLTKVYGLSGLRCGWILAEPELAWSMWRLNDLFGSRPAHPAELLSVAAFQQLDRIRARTQKIVEADRVLLRDFLKQTPSLSAPETSFGTTAMVRLHGRDVNEFLRGLRSVHQTSAVPGSFFEMPQHFRIGMGVNTEMFREGLNRIGAALEERR